MRLNQRRVAANITASGRKDELSVRGNGQVKYERVALVLFYVVIRVGWHLLAAVQDSAGMDDVQSFGHVQDGDAMGWLA